jgi:hypothetical protein
MDEAVDGVGVLHEVSLLGKTKYNYEAVAALSGTFCCLGLEVYCYFENDKLKVTTKIKEKSQ